MYSVTHTNQGVEAVSDSKICVAISPYRDLISRRLRTISAIHHYQISGSPPVYSYRFAGALRLWGGPIRGDPDFLTITLEGSRHPAAVDTPQQLRVAPRVKTFDTEIHSIPRRSLRVGTNSEPSEVVLGVRYFPD